MADDNQIQDTEPPPAISGGGIASSLSRSVMQSGGYNRFDFAVVRVPCSNYSENFARLEDGELTVVCDGKHTVDACNEEVTVYLTPSMERMLAQMLLQDADEREAKARGTEGT